METKINPLLNGLKGEDRKKAEEAILRASDFITLLKPALDKELDRNEEPDFDCPSWAYKEAFYLGYKKGLTKILKYAILKPSKENHFRKENR